MKKYIQIRMTRWLVCKLMFVNRIPKINADLTTKPKANGTKHYLMIGF